MQYSQLKEACYMANTLGYLKHNTAIIILIIQELLLGKRIFKS
jgi:hypothetical protein